MRFTTSWDDGHPLDLRIAELLSEYGCRGTFYVPRRNREGRSVLSRTELRRLGAQFEIGAHSFDHVRLTTVSPAEAAHQVRAIKHALEDELGRSVDGFCYPGGAHDARLRATVRTEFRYARTIENFWFAVPDDPFQLPVTLQLYPHARRTYVKNLARGHWARRARGCGLALHATSLSATLRALLDRAIAIDGVFHLWGHSWELEEHGLWDELEAFLAYVRDRVAPELRIDNAELIASTHAASNRPSV